MMRARDVAPIADCTPMIEDRTPTRKVPKETRLNSSMYTLSPGPDNLAWCRTAEGHCSATCGPPDWQRDLDMVCEVLGEYFDSKSRAWRHSQMVASVAAEITRKLSGSDFEATLARRAGLVHDLGKASVPCEILVKQEALSPAEEERRRLHPYYTERVLSRVPQLKGLAPAAASHHERFDGSGYPQHLSGERIPLLGRVLAIADSYALVIRKQGEEVDAEAAIASLHEQVGSQFDPDCYGALTTAADGGRSPLAVSRFAPDERARELTPRELEVLGRLAKGLSNRQIAEDLVISEKTAQHHLESIYSKLGVTSRTSAVIFAVHNGLA